MQTPVLLRLLLFTALLRLLSAHASDNGDTMQDDWLNRSLKQHGFGFVAATYHSEAQLGQGPLAAASAAALWQEELLSNRFLLPAALVPDVHRRDGVEPDSLKFSFRVKGQSVQSYHTMDRLVLEVQIPFAAGPVDQQVVLRAIADLFHDAFNASKHLRPVVEGYRDGIGGFGRVEAAPGGHSEERSAASLVRWWYRPDGVLLATYKVEPESDDGVPATTYLSPQQVYMWFDTYGVKR